MPVVWSIRRAGASTQGRQFERMTEMAEADPTAGGNPRDLDMGRGAPAVPGGAFGSTARNLVTRT
jgi:hypothetical protein